MELAGGRLVKYSFFLVNSEKIEIDRDTHRQHTLLRQWRKGPTAIAKQIYAMNVNVSFIQQKTKGKTSESEKPK
jgi:hypothetical protein